jgi:hypothetical protein
MQRYRLLARALRQGTQGYEVFVSEGSRSPSDLQSWRGLWGSAASRGETSCGLPEFIGRSEALRGGIWRQQVRHAKVNGSEVNVFLQFCMQRQKLTLLALYPFFFSPFFLINFM